MRVKLDIDFKPLHSRLDAEVSKVYRGTKKATIQAARAIMDDSLDEVPKDSWTLANSAFWDVTGSYKDFEAVLGYGGNGDPVHPTKGYRASEYMVVVHEDLTAVHPNGKAKFLEDPIRRYVADRFPRAIIKAYKEEGVGDTY